MNVPDKGQTITVVNKAGVERRGQFQWIKPQEKTVWISLITWRRNELIELPIVDGEWEWQ